VEDNRENDSFSFHCKNITAWDEQKEKSTTRFRKIEAGYRKKSESLFSQANHLSTVINCGFLSFTTIWNNAMEKAMALFQAMVLS